MFSAALRSDSRSRGRARRRPAPSPPETRELGDAAESRRSARCTRAARRHLARRRADDISGDLVGSAGSPAVSARRSSGSRSNGGSVGSSEYSSSFPIRSRRRRPRPAPGSSTASSSAISRWCSSSRSLWLARLTISRAVESPPYRPPRARSRQRSSRLHEVQDPVAIPSSGAISTEPESRTSSTCIPASGEEASRRVDVLGRDPGRDPTGEVRILAAQPGRRHEPAGAETEVQRLEHVGPMLEEHVVAGHARVRHAGLDVRGDVLTLHRQELEAAVDRRKDEPPAGRVLGSPRRSRGGTRGAAPRPSCGPSEGRSAVWTSSRSGGEQLGERVGLEREADGGPVEAVEAEQSS
jgi:hypothetical protein